MEENSQIQSDSTSINDMNREGENTAFDGNITTNPKETPPHTPPIDASKASQPANGGFISISFKIPLGPSRNISSEYTNDAKANKNIISIIMSHIRNIAGWLSFCVGITLIPLFLSTWIWNLQGHSFDWERPVVHGDLAVIIFPLMGEAAVYLFLNSRVKLIFKVIFGLASIGVIVGSTVLLTVTTAGNPPSEDHNIKVSSYILFISMLVIGCFCKWKEK